MTRQQAQKLKQQEIARYEAELNTLQEYECCYGESEKTRQDRILIEDALRTLHQYSASELYNAD